MLPARPVAELPEEEEGEPAAIYSEPENVSVFGGLFDQKEGVIGTERNNPIENAEIVSNKGTNGGEEARNTRSMLRLFLKMIFWILIQEQLLKSELQIKRQI